MVNYPTFSKKPLLSGTLSITPNVIISKFGGGFTAISQNGKRALNKTLTIVQSLETDAEFQTLEDFMKTNVAIPFVIEYLDRDKTGSTTMTVVFNGESIYSTEGGSSSFTIPVMEF